MKPPINTGGKGLRAVPDIQHTTLYEKTMVVITKSTFVEVATAPIKLFLLFI